MSPSTNCDTSCPITVRIFGRNSGSSRVSDESSPACPARAFWKDAQYDIDDSQNIQHVECVIPVAVSTALSSAVQFLNIQKVINGRHYIEDIDVPVGVNISQNTTWTKVDGDMAFIRELIPIRIVDGESQ